MEKNGSKNLSNQDRSSNAVKQEIAYPAILKMNVPENAKKLSYAEVDQSYDLTEAVGFHGASCHRWAPHFEMYEPEEETDPTDTANVDWAKYQKYAFE